MLRFLLGVAAALLVVGVGGVEVTLNGGGVFKGVTQEAGPGRNFFSFRGIPYAKPPLGPLRFKDPEPAEPWAGTKESFDPPMCPQFSFEGLVTGEFVATGEEDCLYLHVYTPQVCGSELLPVMVFIHGGGFFVGSPDFAGGTALPLLTKDVVLVSIQYRLGTLGFLSTGDGVIPGNMGLKDQTLALRWVQENINNFGGDPDRVTIFGESAGGGSVHFQMLTPKAEGLFHRAIMHSGNALAPWALRITDPKIVAAGVGRQMECSGVEENGKVDSVALLTCLQNKPALELVMTFSQGESFNNFPIQMVPRVDGDYLPAHPAELLRDGRYNKVDVISGVCRHEGLANALVVVTTPAGEQLLSDFAKLAPLSVGTEQEERPLYLAQQIYYRYLGGRNITLTKDNIDELVQMYGDAFFAIPHDNTAQFHARDASYGKGVYMYQLDHLGNHSFTKVYLNATMKIKWVGHGDDVPYLFSDVFGNKGVSRPDDVFLSQVMVELWTNFAATGNPTPDMSMGFRWGPITPSNLQYLSLTPAAYMRPDPRPQIRAFMNDLPTVANKLLFPEKFASADQAWSKREAGEGHCHA